MRRPRYKMACALALWTASSTLAGEVQATIATRGAFALLTGRADGTGMTLIGHDTGPGIRRSESLARAFRFACNDEAFVYLVAWGGAESERGILAEFIANGLPLNSGDGIWQCVPAQLGHPAKEPLNLLDVIALVQDGNRRHGWLPIVTRGRNGSGPIGPVSEINRDAEEMWAPEDRARGASAVLFRIAPQDLFPPFSLAYTDNGEGPASGNARRNAGGEGLLGGGGRGAPGGGGGATPPGASTFQSAPNPQFPILPPSNNPNEPPTIEPPPERANPPIIPPFDNEIPPGGNVPGLPPAEFPPGVGTTPPGGANTPPEGAAPPGGLDPPGGNGPPGIPEPSTGILILGGMMVVSCMRRRR